MGIGVLASLHFYQITWIGFEKQIMQFITNFVSQIVHGISYSVEHMSVLQWSIMGTTSVVLGFMCLRTTKF